MKYIAVELRAIDEVIGSRFLQSTEFEQGANLAGLLKGRASVKTLTPKVSVTSIGDGVFITASKDDQQSRYIVIDVQQSGVFNELSEPDSLFAFQKILRFSKKIWQGLAFNFSERIIPNSTKALLFPFRGFKPAPYRVVFEREPMADRLAKRGDSGKFLLVFKAGYDGAGAKGDVAELTNFRKAYEALPALRVELSRETMQTATTSDVDQLQVCALPPSAAFRTGSMYRPYDDWMALLTTQQRKFVDAPIVGPFRIEGAAGTGKTLSLMLKAVSALRLAKAEGREFHAVFLTHSDATRRTISEVLSVIDPDQFSGADRSKALQTLKVCTLSELCAEQLRQSISEAEFIDRDAMESKDLQLLYIGEALSEAMKSDFPSHERFLSPAFATFLRSEDSWKITEMLQHEISVIIKGRASEDLDKYKKATALKYGLPVSRDADKGFVFTIFRLYQAQLGYVGQFDTDDVVLSTIGQLETPIWRRRRSREGYDAIFVDETHLFNINELHLFHYFSKSEGPYPIVYSVDRSQAVGDRGWNTDEISECVAVDSATHGSQKILTNFRSSVDILNFAFSIVSSGATLFTNFDNPLTASASAFTEEDEKLAAPPIYLNVPNEEALIEAAFERADKLHRDMNCRRSDILLVTLEPALLKRMEQYAADKKKPHLLLKRRGDVLAVESAREYSQLVLGHADFVGGLEFFGVVLVGIDGGRVPPATSADTEGSRNYLAYAAHNRLYVAVTRARYRVEVLGEKARGPSRILQPAIQDELLSVSDIG